MKRHAVRMLSALAAAALLFSAAPAHANETIPPPTGNIIVKPDPSDRILPPRPPRIPCPIKPAPPGWSVPLYCDILPIPKPPWDGIGPIIPGPKLPVEPPIEASA